ncbi:hypothetical protein HPG69_016326 [Diceros bicornis minor]|uniref:Uncharacterized protein n=1 Tax=Diceros bicornis minor TaxID=77932 RepID=A0A7J7F7I1_DICBM|nr:hypothetical protein HPG69_016326 [Diceros bicornis minor]
MVFTENPTDVRVTLSRSTSHRAVLKLTVACFIPRVLTKQIQTAFWELHFFVGLIEAHDVSLITVALFNRFSPALCEHCHPRNNKGMHSLGLM